MKRLYFKIILSTLALIFGSCASMFNSESVKLKIITSEPCKIILPDDTLTELKTHNYAEVDRDENDLIITAFNDSLSKSIVVESGNSFAYWLNLNPFILWAGFIIDQNDPKRFTYPKTIYIDMHKNDSSYLTYPYDKSLEKYSNTIKLTPLKLTGFTNSSVEISYERKTSEQFATQFMASYLLPNNDLMFNKSFKHNNNGFCVSIEEKYYYKKSAPMGPYVSFEFNYLNNHYRDIETYEHNTINTIPLNSSYQDSIGIYKQTFSFNIKYGYHTIINRLSIDFYIGMGLRYKDVSYYDRINPKDNLWPQKDASIELTHNEYGKFWTISMPLNVRFGWVF